MGATALLQVPQCTHRHCHQYLLHMDHVLCRHPPAALRHRHLPHWRRLFRHDVGNVELDILEYFFVNLGDIAGSNGLSYVSFYLGIVFVLVFVEYFLAFSYIMYVLFGNMCVY